jgi:hypothetical protein
MSGGIYPKAKALVPGIFRSLSSIVLILMTAGCVYLSFAAMEAPRDIWWKFWTIYAAVGLSCLLGAGWLLRRSLSFVVLNLIAAVCVYLSLGVLDGPREYWWSDGRLSGDLTTWQGTRKGGQVRGARTRLVWLKKRTAKVTSAFPGHGDFGRPRSG